MEKISFVIPCYNSEHTLADVIGRVITTVQNHGGYDYEVVCVNDYSKDGTIDVLRKLAKENKKIKVLSFSRNFGQHSALMAGFNYVTGDIVMCLDDDGQNPPEEMFRLIDKLKEGYDLVSAKYSKKKHSLFRNFGSKVSSLMSDFLVGKPKDIDLNSFYVFRRFVLDEVIKYKNAYPFVHGLILRVTRNMANVEIDHQERAEGHSGYNFKKLFGLWMNGFTAFSEKPLRMSTFAGMICAMIGFIFGIYVIIRKILHPEVLAGYSSNMAVLLLIGGLMMFFLGLIGEYIGRIYICINNAPQFALKDMINIDEDEEKKNNK